MAENISETVVVAPPGSELPPETSKATLLSVRTASTKPLAAMDYLRPGPKAGLELRRAVARLISAGELLAQRVAVLHHTTTAWALTEPLTSSGTYVIVNLHNVETTRLPGVLALGRHNRRARLEASAIRRAEAHICQLGVPIAVCTEDDALAVRRLGAEDVLVCPNGVSDSLFGLGAPARPGAQWLFTGDLGYLPNVQGLEWFARTVLPLLPPRVGRSILLAGARPHPTVRRLAATLPDVTLLEAPRDMEPLLAAADFCLNPTLTGGGMAHKIVQYAAAGRPFVATPNGARGFPPTPDPDCIAGSPESFASAMTTLEAMDEVERADLAGAFRMLAGRFRWDVVLEPLRERVEALVREPRERDRRSLP